MGRVSRAQAEAHRAAVVEAASRLVRERGMSQVSVPEVMAAAGLTHGGFYRQFESKDDLVSAACSSAFEEQETIINGFLQAGKDKADARAKYVVEYLSEHNRDDPGHGCAIAAFSADVARSAPDSPLRESFGEGLTKSLDSLARLGDRPEDADARKREVLVELAAMVGALTIARATSGHAVSEEILTAVREHLLDRTTGDKPS
ncbi:TetR/AcrR family transcriptional regulator [Microbispora sp. NEAU-D428]|uniref:TetR/AcrR family transcriptional regulator n=1 Tax=Microbispora sitophila TaxID=2771537 RepID=UPI001868EBE8|nr:TetR/AcrR family transcriptional regulator [Microbispora sitophila]MBE3015117.1 TetR/AcrR family transcriptional regulator [Microbispora sitophila]